MTSRTFGSTGPRRSLAFEARAKAGLREHRQTAPPIESQRITAAGHHSSGAASSASTSAGGSRRHRLAPLLSHRRSGRDAQARQRAWRLSQPSGSRWAVCRDSEGSPFAFTATPKGARQRTRPGGHGRRPGHGRFARRQHRRRLRLPPRARGSGKHVIPTIASRSSPSTGTSRGAGDAHTFALPARGPYRVACWHELDSPLCPLRIAAGKAPGPGKHWGSPSSSGGAQPSSRSWSAASERR
jgi:hypothetical protein